jgi:hypothetical protein
MPPRSFFTKLDACAAPWHTSSSIRSCQLPMAFRPRPSHSSSSSQLLPPHFWTALGPLNTLPSDSRFLSLHGRCREMDGWRPLPGRP